MTNQTTQQEMVVEELAVRIAEYLAGEKGAVEESALVAKFRGFGRIRTLALRALAERGLVRRTRNAEGTRVIALFTAEDHVILATAGLAETRQDRLAAERRDALKPTAEEYGTDTESYRFYAEMLAAGRISAEDLPFNLPVERDEVESWRKQYRKNNRRSNRAKLRRGKPGKDLPNFSAAAQAERRRAGERDFLSPEARRAVEEQLASGDAAWETAKAQYVAGLPTLAHKILHLLARDGARTEASFVALAEAEEHPIPHKAVREAVQELGEAGKIRKRRSRTDGRVYLAPLERMPKRELETLLIGVMADPRSGIPVPEGSKLARRVEGFRKAKAEKQAAAREERAAEQPVGA